MIQAVPRVADELEEGDCLIEKFHECIFIAKLSPQLVAKRVPGRILDLGTEQLNDVVRSAAVQITWTEFAPDSPLEEGVSSEPVSARGSLVTG